jgi:cobalt-zinc-cadmium efflux system outer membrane protein
LSLSFAQAEQLWHNKNRELQLAHNQLRGAAADQVIAAQKPNPTLSFNTTSIATGQPAFMKQADSVVRIDQLYERGDKRSLRIREADLRADAARADFADTQRQGLIDLSAHYYDLALAQEQLHIAEENARLFRQSVTAAQLRLQAGDLAAADVARLQVDALRAENDVESAKNLQLQAQLALAYRIGADPDAAQLSASDHWPEVQPLAAFTSIAAIVAQRPDIIAADQRAAAAEAAFAQAQALRTRDVTVGVQVEHNGQNRPLNTIGLGFSVPLLTGYTYAGEITHARIDLESAQRIAEQTRAQAYVEIGNARSDLATAQAQVDRFDRELLQASQRALDAAELGYRHGAMPLMDLLDARRTFKSTQIDAAAAHANYAKALVAWQALTTLNDTDTAPKNNGNRVAIEENP